MKITFISVLDLPQVDLTSFWGREAAERRSVKEEMLLQYYQRGLVKAWYPTLSVG